MWCVKNGDVPLQRTLAEAVLRESIYNRERENLSLLIVLIIRNCEQLMVIETSLSH